MSLANLIAKQKGMKPNVDSIAGQTAGTSAPAVASTPTTPDPPEPAPVPESQPAPAQAPAATGTGFRLGGVKLIGSQPTGAGRTQVHRAPVPADAEVPRESADRSDDNGNDSGERDGGISGPVFDSLDALAETELGLPPVRETPPTQFPDLIDVQLPERDLPVDITVEGLAFVDQLNVIYSVLHDGELFGQVIRQIMQELQEHPEYIQMIADEDSHVMIRGLRESMGLAQIKKAEKKRTSPNPNAKKPSKVREIDALLDSSGMDFS